jgi:hypothetical protein
MSFGYILTKVRQHKGITAMTEPNKAKLPDLKEVTGMATKLFTDVKNSITEIMQDYKAKRVESGIGEAPSTHTDKSAKPAKPSTAQTSAPEQATPPKAEQPVQDATEASPDKQAEGETSAPQDKPGD